MTDDTLGLCETPTPFHIYIGEAPGKGLWYFLEPNTKNKVTVQESALRGSLRELRVIQKEGQKPGEMLDKLEVVVDADRLYVLRSGLETQWSRCILLALEVTDDLGQILYFCVRPSDRNEKIVFGSVYTEKKVRVMPEWDGERDMRPVVTSLRARLGLEEAPALKQQEASAQQVTPNGNGAKPLARAEAHARIHEGRKKLVDDGFETWKSLNETLGREYGCVEVEELTREDAVKYLAQLRELYRRHVGGRVAEAVRT